MPKDVRKHVLELQKQRQRIKQQSVKYTPAQVYIQVMGHGTRGESRSVMLCTDHWNYLFNCGEGTQRLASEHHAKLAKMEHIFVTKSTWDNLGGLPGVALTVQETGIPSIYLHGPEDSIGIMEATESFVTLTELSVKSADMSKSFNDQTMTVDYVLLKKPNKLNSDNSDDCDIVIENINFYGYEINSNGKRPTSPNQQGSKSKILRRKSQTDDLMIYICKLHKKLGSLHVEKCVQLGVPMGPLLGKLKAGEDVTLPNGTVVKSTDVVGFSEPGPILIVLECPDEDWIDLIIENSAFAKFQNNVTDLENIVHTIVHFTPENVIQNTKYSDWMRNFGPNTLHLVINEKNTGYSSEAMHKMQHQLNLIHPTIFPSLKNEESYPDHNLSQKKDLNYFLSFLKENSKPNSNNTESDTETNKCDNLDQNFLKEGLHIRRCKTMDIVYLRPNKGLNTDGNVKVYLNQYIQELVDIEGFVDSLTELHKQIDDKTKSLGDNIEEYPRLLMLGTGSSVPNKVRNTSGMLFSLDKDRSILLDCGEATVNQIVRLFGETEADEILKSIQAIYISHLHADHHIGLIGLLKQRKQITDEPVYLIAPQQITPYLYYYHKRFDPIGDNFKLISNKDIILNQCTAEPEVLKELYESLNIANISTSFVTHCPYAYAVAITLKDGRKICYSGDTMPCDSLVKLAQNSFLLIHEATMEDDLANEAIIKRHSTFSQAINAGVKAEVNFTLLTHFSQRYCKLPRLPDLEQSGFDFNRVGIAYDFMLISLSRLPLLPLFYKTLSIMFQEFREELEQRALKRELGKERSLKTIEPGAS